MEEKIKVICTQCGAALIPDKENMIYRCTHCGVAFGSSIIFDRDAVNKARKALSFAEFNEADVWFQCVLMLCPDDFEALRGRVLCAGKWCSFMDIKEPFNMPAVRFARIRDSIDDAIAHAELSDIGYFENCKKMIDTLELVWNKDVQIKPLTEKKAQLEENLKLTPVIETGDIGYYTVKSSIVSVIAQITPLVNEKKDLLTKFNMERQSVIYFEKKKLYGRG